MSYTSQGPLKLQCGPYPHFHDLARMQHECTESSILDCWMATIHRQCNPDESANGGGPNITTSFGAPERRISQAIRIANRVILTARGQEDRREKFLRRSISIRVGHKKRRNEIQKSRAKVHHQPHSPKLIDLALDDQSIRVHRIKLPYPYRTSPHLTNAYTIWQQMYPQTVSINVAIGEDADWIPRESGGRSASPSIRVSGDSVLSLLPHPLTHSKPSFVGKFKIVLCTYSGSLRPHSHRTLRLTII
jgi:hypothetical protein